LVPIGFIRERAFDSAPITSATLMSHFQPRFAIGLVQLARWQ